MNDDALDVVENWLGLPYEAMRCYDLVVRAFALRGVPMPPDYMASLPMFRLVSDPQPWDLIAIRNHPIVVNHVGLMVTPTMFIHSMEDVGVTTGFVDRAPWPERTAGFLRLKDRYLEIR